MAEKIRVCLTVNGKDVCTEVEPRMTLVDFLRTELGLTGTHIGCEHGVCGTCTVMMDGEAVRSCLMFAVQAGGRQVTTVEGLALDGELSPLQSSFRRHHALQCGYCTPGMLMSATAFLKRCPHPTADQVRDALSGNICRCTGYIPIIDAVLEVSQCASNPKE